MHQVLLWSDREHIRLRPRRTEPGVKRMADDSPAPPLTRRVPGAARGGPRSLARPVLPEALLKRMQAAVDAARAGQGQQADQAAFTKAGGGAAVAQASPRPAARKIRRRGPRVAGVAALAVIIAAAVAFALSSRSSARITHSPQSHKPQAQPPQAQKPPPQTAQSLQAQPPDKPVSTASLAAGWVAAQVGHDIVVACDRAMCDELTAHGFPGRHLRLIRPHASVPPHAQVVVVTPAVQRQFGSSHTTKWAPAVLASFGARTAGISVRIAAAHGAARYEAALKADLRSRKAAGAALLTKPHLSASATARKQLLAGQVDSRLIVDLKALASVHPIRILDFGTAFAGASAGIPLRIANLARDYPAAGLPRSAYLRFLFKELNLERGMYKPDAVGLAHDATGTLTFQIKFPAPSPLGVLGSKAA
jgi:hypothetical protein